MVAGVNSFLPVRPDHIGERTDLFLPEEHYFAPQLPW